MQKLLLWDSGSVPSSHNQVIWFVSLVQTIISGCSSPDPVADLHVTMRVRPHPRDSTNFLNTTLKKKYCNMKILGPPLTHRPDTNQSSFRLIDNGPWAWEWLWFNTQIRLINGRVQVARYCNRLKPNPSGLAIRPIQAHTCQLRARSAWPSHWNESGLGREQVGSAEFECN